MTRPIEVGNEAIKLYRTHCMPPRVDSLKVESYSSNQSVGMVGYRNNQLSGGSKQMKPAWGSCSDPNQNGRRPTNSVNPYSGNGSWATKNRSPNRPNNSPTKP